ncbi:MAG: sensor histidine kinase [Burkholderiaceae bacterium]|nr:sensor histidine kinase [Burkholderiaceae bacterium]
MHPIAEPRYPLQSQLRILVFADSAAEHERLLAELGEQGLNVQGERAPDLEALSQALGAARWDAVVCVAREGRVAVQEAIAVVSRTGKHLACVVVSDQQGARAAVAAIRAGADDYLVAGQSSGLAAALLGAMRSAAARADMAQRESRLLESEQHLRALTGHLQSVIESERAAIAREIHDEIGGTLTALRFDLAWIARNGDAGSAQRATQSLESVAVAEQAGQRLVRDLRPPILDAGVMAALEWLLAQFRKRTGAKATLRANTDRFELSDPVAMTVYRTLQEALTNVVKHAGATRVDVDLVVRDRMLSLEILDDGRGIGAGDPEKIGSFGIRGLKERAHSVGGWLELSAARRGTALLLTVPIQGGGAPAPGVESAP